MKNDTKSGSGLAGSVLWGCVALVLLAIGLMAALRPVPEEVADSPEKAVAVRTLVVEGRTVADTVVIPGRVEPIIDALLATEMGGRITEIGADKGDEVTAGQVLLRIDDRAVAAQVRRALVEDARAVKDIERFMKLRETGAVAPTDFDDIELRRDVARAGREAAEVALSKCAVRSPFDGVVDDRIVEVGEYALEGGPVFRVVNVDRVKVMVDIPERDVLAVREGDVMTFGVPVHGDQVFTGTVAFVALVAGQRNSAYRAEVVCDNEGGLLRPGMIADVLLTRGILDGAVVLPLAAVIPKNGEHTVFIVEGDRAVRRVVKILSISGREAVLSSGVQAGDPVVVEGHRSLQDGALVTVMDDTE